MPPWRRRRTTSWSCSSSGTSCPRAARTSRSCRRSSRSCFERSPRVLALAAGARPRGPRLPGTARRRVPRSDGSSTCSRKRSRHACCPPSSGTSIKVALVPHSGVPPPPPPPAGGCRQAGGPGHASPGQPVATLVVQSMRVPEPPADFPELAPEHVPCVGATRQLRKVAGGVLCSHLLLHPLSAAEQAPPDELASSLAGFCAQYPVQRREYERRALQSIVAPRLQGDLRIQQLLMRLGNAISPPAPGSLAPPVH
mmetsp:Transcript_52816/g.136771  ORF Transcript_52816/g.136771 Transcript_52816/m.136771 type:complete len:254 (+) Transcript_52816:2321-3082(+)